MITRYRRAAGAVALALVLAACGGSDGDDAAPVTSAATESSQLDDTDTGDTDDATSDEPGDDARTGDDAGSDDSDDVPSSGDSSDGTFTPGEIEFRAVNLLDEPVDLYARTTGLVEAFLVQPGLAPGEVSDRVAPPEDGTFLVTQAGADDPTCVTTCDHFVAQLSTFPTEGPVRTVVLWGDEFDPYQAFELWEQPTDEAIAASNAMPPADPSSVLAVVTAIALTDADFGVRAGTDGTCLDPTNLAPSNLVGGTATPAYALDPAAATISFFDRDDLECAEAPVGGPFGVPGDAGSRAHVILSGSPGDMEAIVLPMEPAQGGGTDAADAADAGDGSEGGDEAVGGADRDLAIELLTADIATDGLFDADQSACFAEVLVDAVGPDAVVVDGALSELDPDTISPEVANQLFDAFGDAVEACGIDPALLGL